MKKKHIGMLLGVIFLIFILFPFIIGYMVKQHYNDALKMISQKQVNIKIVKYKHFLYYSDVTLATNFPLADKPLNLDNLTNEKVLLLKQRIYHGPVIFYNNPNHMGLKFAIAYIDSYFDDQHYFAETTLALNMRLITLLNLNQFALNEGKNIIYSIIGLKGNIIINSSRTKIDTSIALQKLFTKLDTPREISNFYTEQHLTKNQRDLWTGARNYHFGRIAWQQNSKYFAFENFNYSLKSQIVNEHYDVMLGANVQTSKINNIDYGAQKILLTFSKLDGEQLKLLQAEQPVSNTQGSAIQTAKFQHQLLTLLNQGANIEVNDLALNTAWGPVALKANLSCPCNNNAQNFPALFSKTDTNIEGQIPTELAKDLLTDYFLLRLGQQDAPLAKQQAEASLSSWEKNGWLTPSGGVYSISFNYNSSNNHGQGMGLHP